MKFEWKVRCPFCRECHEQSIEIVQTSGTFDLKVRRLDSKVKNK